MNPFKKGTTSYNDFKKLSNLKWHCAKCQLESEQAKIWQVWRQQGIQLDIGENGGFYRKMFCKKCKKNTTHRKLKSLEIAQETIRRTTISNKLSLKIKEIYQNTEALLLRKMTIKELEIDHKFPQIRWKQDEENNKDNMSETEIKNKFILLTRANNLLKSRYCEKCYKIGKRGIFPGIYFWYEGSENWNLSDKNDKKGCIGCFWFDPFQWRAELNKLLSKLKK
ncbi:MAG: hypothetical protein LBT79_05950 [Elusimicrobiota bacterium]|jgi:hypothetical protein|nr:hypothetical protein [Elusimicrobiota bacterium]